MNAPDREKINMTATVNHRLVTILLVLLIILLALLIIGIVAGYWMVGGGMMGMMSIGGVMTRELSTACIQMMQNAFR